MARRSVVFPGSVFGRLTVVERVGIRKSPTGKTSVCLWVCACSCGKEATVSNANLSKGVTNSCGCIHREQLIGRNTKHGHAATPIYKVWLTMNQRCTNPRVKNWDDYGGRGITVCESWKTFEQFYTDMAPTYVQGLTLERENNNAGYSKDNCVWASRLVQAGNRRTTAWFDLHGKRTCLEVAARIIGVTSGAIRYWRKRGLTDEQITDYYETKRSDTP